MELLSTSFIFGSEISLTLLIFATFASRAFLPTSAIKSILIIEVLVYSIIVAARPFDYNSDTKNYFGYRQLFIDLEYSELILATKFEPLHLALINLSPNFQWWLILESAIYFSLFIVVCQTVKRLETIAIILGCSLPLLSSSVRFAVAVMCVAAALQRLRGVRWKLGMLTIIGGASHVIMLATGLFERRKLIIIIFVAIVLFFIVPNSESLVERSGLADDNTGFHGLRTAGTLLLFSAYLTHLFPKYKKDYLWIDIVSTLILLVVASAYLPTVNRLMIVLLIVMTESLETLSPRSQKLSKHQCLFSTLFFASLSFPSWIPLLDQDTFDKWQSSAQLSLSAKALELSALAAQGSLGLPDTLTVWIGRAAALSDARTTNPARVSGNTIAVQCPNS